MLIDISDSSTLDLKGATDDDIYFINNILAGIQNELGEDEFGTLKKIRIKMAIKKLYLEKCIKKMMIFPSIILRF